MSAQRDDCFPEINIINLAISSVTMNDNAGKSQCKTDNAGKSQCKTEYDEKK